MSRRVALHVFLTNALHESRFLKEASSSLRAGLFDSVMLAARWRPGLAESEELAPGVSVARIRLRTLSWPRGLIWALGKDFEWRQKILSLGTTIRPRVIHSHSIRALPVGVQLSRRLRVPLVYDAHELETERNGLRGFRRILDKLIERLYIGRCQAVLCVGDRIAEWYAAAYGIPRPFVVRNIPERRMTSPGRTELPVRSRLGIPGDAMLFLYQGAFFRGRRLEQFIRVFQQSRSDQHLVFLGYGDALPMIQAATAHPRIHYLPAVPPGQVLAVTAQADVGLVGVENICLSYYYSLPNKLFEYVLAGIPSAAPAFPEIEHIVRRHGCGWVVGESDQEWIDWLCALTPHQVTQARQATQAAAAHFDWSSEEQVLLAAYHAALRKG